MPGIARTLVRNVEWHGCRYDPAAPITILLDTPHGFAPHILGTLGTSRRSLIIGTWSYCPEYWEDLWDLHPNVLIAGNGLDLDMTAAVQRVAQGERYRMTPDGTTLLTPAERRMLRLLAYGQSNQQVAEQMIMKHQTVKNVMATIYKKLGIKNRTEAALYYWGIWQIFELELPSALERFRG